MVAALYPLQFGKLLGQVILWMRSSTQIVELMQWTESFVASIPSCPQQLEFLKNQAAGHAWKDHGKLLLSHFDWSLRPTLQPQAVIPT